MPHALHRRTLLLALGAGSACALAPSVGWPQAADRPRMRLIIDTDFGGDPDGLFELAQHVLSPSVEISAIIGSHLHRDDPFDPSDQQSAHAAAKAAEVMRLAGKSGLAPIFAGENRALASDQPPALSAATRAIVAEALRPDPRPLYYVAGAGLTEIALAWMAEPRIAQRLTLIWIGGPEHHPPRTPTPASRQPEYNLTIDTLAAQIVFGRSEIPIWQVPRDAYRQMLISSAELKDIATTGPLGAYLASQVMRVSRLAGSAGLNIGETYILGDSPLVTLTALQSSFEADPSSSDYFETTTPGIAPDGSYIAAPAARPMRVYRTIDTRLTFADLIAKLRQSGR